MCTDSVDLHCKGLIWSLATLHIGKCHLHSGQVTKNDCRSHSQCHYAFKQNSDFQSCYPTELWNSRVLNPEAPVRRKNRCLTGLLLGDPKGHVCVHVFHVCMFICGGQRTTFRSFLCPGNWTRVTRFSSTCLNLLSYPVSPRDSSFQLSTQNHSTALYFGNKINRKQQEGCQQCCLTPLKGWRQWHFKLLLY